MTHIIPGNGHAPISIDQAIANTRALIERPPEIEMRPAALTTAQALQHQFDGHIDRVLREQLLQLDALIAEIERAKKQVHDLAENSKAQIAAFLDGSQIVQALVESAAITLDNVRCINNEYVPVRTQ